MASWFRKQKAKKGNIKETGGKYLDKKIA